MNKLNVMAKDINSDNITDAITDFKFNSNTNLMYLGICENTHEYVFDDDNGDTCTSAKLKQLRRADLTDYPLVVRDTDVDFKSSVLLLNRNCSNPARAYEVTDTGEIYEVALYEDDNTCELHIVTEKLCDYSFMHANGGDYIKVYISGIGWVFKHSVVAFAFGLYDGKSSRAFEINHKDHDIYNNSIYNIEAVIKDDNRSHGKFMRYLDRFGFTKIAISAKGFSEINFTCDRKSVLYVLDLLYNRGTISADEYKTILNI